LGIADRLINGLEVMDLPISGEGYAASLQPMTCNWMPHAI
jgi:hypothetical protein